MRETIEFLKKYPFENLLLEEWNTFYTNHSELNIEPKNHLSLVDWVWLSQDFHLFVYRNILGLYKNAKKQFSITTDFEPTTIEGSSALANHLRYERDRIFVQLVKSRAIKKMNYSTVRFAGFLFLKSTEK